MSAIPSQLTGSSSVHSSPNLNVVVRGFFPRIAGVRSARFPRHERDIHRVAHQPLRNPPSLSTLSIATVHGYSNLALCHLGQLFSISTFHNAAGSSCSTTNLEVRR
jgi:hypothetical protein